MQNYEENIKALGERTELSMREVINASNPNSLARNLVLGCVFVGLFGFAAGALFISWARTNTQLTNIHNTFNAAWQVYYLNQEAIEQCQQNFKSKSGMISCSTRLVVPSQ